MEEFRLPDRRFELSVVEGRLKAELSDRESEYHLVKRNLPAGVNPQRTPAFYSLLVAHRKWQFAYEKLHAMNSRYA